MIIQVMTQAVTAEGNSLTFTGKKLEIPVVIYLGNFILSPRFQYSVGLNFCTIGHLPVSSTKKVMKNEISRKFKFLPCD